MTGLKMPRYDNRYSNTHLYVGRLFTRTRFRDLEGLFNRYGSVYGLLPNLEVNGERVALVEFDAECLGDSGDLRDMDMKHDYAFVEFSDPRDTDDARYGLNGREFDGSRIIVEFAKG
ncbi:unnamed protein product [Camellia sinensis]